VETPSKYDLLMDAKDGVESSNDFSPKIPEGEDVDPLCSTLCAVSEGLDRVVEALTARGGLAPSKLRDAAFALLRSIEAKLLELEVSDEAIARLLEMTSPGGSATTAMTAYPARAVRGDMRRRRRRRGAPH
jgi:hypothetical protein